MHVLFPKSKIGQRILIHHASNVLSAEMRTINKALNVSKPETVTSFTNTYCNDFRMRELEENERDWVQECSVVTRVSYRYMSYEMLKKSAELVEFQLMSSNRQMPRDSKKTLIGLARDKHGTATYRLKIAIQIVF